MNPSQTDQTQVALNADSTGATILIVDDIPANLNLLREALEPQGYKILGTTSGERALQIAHRTTPDLILLDIVMPGIDGFETCRRLKAEPKTADIPVIFITVKDEVENIVTGFQVGGVDYLTKSAQKEELLARVKTHLKISQLTKSLLETSIQLAQTNRELKQEMNQRKQEQEAREQAEDALLKADERLSLISQQEASRWGIEGFIGKSRTIAAILDEVRKLQSAGATSVLILGESGTGKELIARAIHFGSARAKSPFIPVNCSTIPKELAESTLFGHVRGAFTGANQSRKGHFELASGGTLFLDEIGDLPFELQPKLLRVLEEGCFTPLGGTTKKQVDVRILAATNPDLPKKIAAGKFREDLYFRLARFPVTVPPLRERREDIPLLVEHFLRTFGAEMGIEHPKISVEALESSKAYHFPGNVRELKNIIEHALILSGREQILPQHLHFVHFTSVEQRVDENLLVPHQVIQSQEDLKSVQKFISECCEIAPNLEVRKPEILAQYLDFCHAFGYRPVSRNKFYELVLELCPQVVATQLGKERLAGFKGLSVTKLFS
ncbi:response regulator [Candidatus Poribacteria bacterium]|nr:response regulator [Candidatus Poribacteria bacterium]